MKHTYLNDLWSTVYPFAPGSNLPFPMQCVVGAGVCVKPNKGQTECPAVMVTSMEITSDAISAFICLGSYPVGLVTCGSKTQQVVRLSTEDWDVAAWFTPGSLQGCEGSYPCSLILDSTCVQFMPQDQYGTLTEVYVNGERHAVPETFTVEMSGMLSMRLVGNGRATDVIGNTDIAVTTGGALVADVWGSVVDIAQTAILSTYTEYPMVDKINGIEVMNTPSRDYSRTLTLVFSGLPGEAMQDYMRVGLSGTVVSYSDVNTQDETDMTLPGINPGAFAERGAALCITLEGSHLIPNCYTKEEDQAYHP